MNPEKPRAVLDTNLVISWLLRPRSVPGQAVDCALDRAVLLMSRETVDELLAVLAKPKFARYYDPQQAALAVQAFIAVTEIVSVNVEVKSCRDADDDKFLALALSGRAAFIVTGDDDLLTLHPFQNIAIITPKQFMNLYGELP